MNRIVSFSLYGNNPKYVIGAHKNIEICQRLMPEWKIKIFTNHNVTSLENIQRLSNYSNVIIVDPESIFPCENLYSMGAFWRFFAFFDNSVALSRDLDSRITTREINYINSWINNDSTPHIFIIRDHPWQSLAPAGLIGMQNLGLKFYNFFVDFINNESLNWGQDQVILENFISSYYNDINVYRCESNTLHYIPRDDKSFFIGIQLDENDKPICPRSLQYLNDLNL